MKNSVLKELPIQQSKAVGLLLVLALVCVVGCGHKETLKNQSVSQAQKAFQDKCVKDFNIHVRTYQVGHTFWIYLPVKDPIFDYEVHKPQPDSEKGPQFVLNSSEGKFENGIFSFEYDIIDKKKSKSEDSGFGTSYTDNYSKTQGNIFTALYEVFSDVKAKPSEEPIEFFVIVITDIKKGLETRFTFYWEDLIRLWGGDIPSDEFYNKRVLSDIKGSPAMIGDETGSHITYTNVTMEKFLTDQILNRIRFKFQRSDFPPSQDYDSVIVGIVADTLRYYHFEDFTNVRLNNLRLNHKWIYEKSQLKNFGEDKPEDENKKGHLIHIRFKDGKPEFNEDSLSDQPTSTSLGKTNQ